MCDSLEMIRQSLCAMAQSYHTVAEGGRLKPREWIENVKLLKPVAGQLQQVAEAQIAQCQTELDEKIRAQSLCLTERANQYALMDQRKSALSDLDAEVLGLMAQMNHISDCIAQKQKELKNAQQRVSEAKAQRKKWDTVFWATCWLPLVNIGTGSKKIDADAGYYANAKQLSEEINALKAQSSVLNCWLTYIRQKKEKKSAESAELIRQITATNGRVAQITTAINELSRQICLWRTIREGCAEISIRLDHVNGDIAAVETCFEELLKVEELLKIPSTTRFVAGRICKGSCLRAGESLKQDEYLMSPNRKYIAVLRADNALVVYNSEQELWSSGTQGAKGKSSLCLDGRGPAALVGTDRVWNTKRPGVVSLVMQDDGNLVAYDHNGRSLWATDTFTYANVESLRFQDGAAEQASKTNIIKGEIKMNDKQMALQCIQMMEKYMDEVKNLPNDNKKLVGLANEDMMAWRQVYYPELSRSGKVRDTSFFEQPLKNPNTGIGQDGTFTKYEYVQFLWSAYKFVMGDFSSNPPALEYIKGCIKMLEPYAASFENKGNETELVCSLNDKDGRRWREDYYPRLSKSGMIPDGSFFGNVNQEHRYGIGEDGSFSGEELCHFLFRLYRQAYIMLN